MGGKGSHCPMLLSEIVDALGEGGQIAAFRVSLALNFCCLIDYQKLW